MRIALLSIFIGLCSMLSGQINYTANDRVPSYSDDFGYGTNLGYYEGWTDEELADIAAGNRAKSVSGVGVNTLRPWLPEWFLDQWGYDIRVPAFQHYKNLGIINITPFIGNPSENSREQIEHCPGIRSPMFKNMWAEIWDNGENGTPVNDANFYALYIYKMVEKYKFNVRFWEVLNEPDFDYVGHAYLPKEDPKSWWNKNPEPCESGLRAPIFYYVRMLRISYEVIKFLDPNAFVSIAGLGYPSFLDAVLRNTDNPEDGSISTKYPHRGGAYFDAMCYHSYPHFDGSLRYWSNSTGGFVHTRHSDAAAAGVVNKKADFETVLFDYGYDGQQFPQKEWIITESNIPRKAFGEYIGSSEAQRNFIIKTLVKCQQNNIRQYHIFSIAETGKFQTAQYEFELMGLYKNLEGVSKYQQEPTELGIAYHSTAQSLKAKSYDQERTTQMKLPEKVDGAAFKDPSGKFTYVLWAKTSADRSEAASAKYSFPDQLIQSNFEIRQWDFGKTGAIGAASGKNLQLTGSPVFLSEAGNPLSDYNASGAEFFQMEISPNPALNQSWLRFQLPDSGRIQLVLVNLKGQVVRTILPVQKRKAGWHELQVYSGDLPKGIYFLNLIFEEKSAVLKLVIN